MKKILTLLLLFVTILFAKDSVTTYYRGSTQKIDRGIEVTYINPVLKDTLISYIVPGTSLPFKVDIKDGVAIENKDLIFFHKVNQDTTQQ